MACQFHTVPSPPPFLIGSLAIDYTQLGTLSGLYMLAGIFMALPGGMLGRRFGAKRLVLAGLLLVAAGGAPMGAGCNFLLVANGRPLSGVGGILPGLAGMARDLTASAAAPALFAAAMMALSLAGLAGFRVATRYE